MPRVSVVIPVYNAAEFLPRTLGDLSAQSLRDFEVICVDDESSDASPELIAAYARTDPRFRLIRQPNGGSTAARNRGLDAATGSYVVFLDADDAFEPSLLEQVSGRLDDSGADVCLYNGSVLTDDGTVLDGRYLRRQFLPEAPVFAPSVVADNLFQLVTPAVWLRMFRRSFLVEAGLRFTPGQIPDDICFTADSLAAADSITVIDEVFIRYRVGHAGAATSRWDERPLAFEEALDDLAARLAARGQLETYGHSFRVLCLDAISHVMRRLVTDAARDRLQSELESRLLAKYGLDTLRPGSVALGPLRADLKVFQGSARVEAAAPDHHPGSRWERTIGAVRRRLRRLRGPAR